jgi:hypothetical protein
MKNFERILLPEIINIASAFEPITLKEMDQVAFMNRTDTKYIASSRQIPALLKLAMKKYQMLEIEQMRAMPYSTTYFDTEDYHFYNEQIKGKMNRCKVRHRVYLTSGIAFMEVKFKSNKNRTIKWRIRNEWSQEQSLNTDAISFLNNNIDVEAEKLVPILDNRFTRLTLVNNADKERITIDFNMSFTDMKGHTEHLPYLAILELKREGFTCQSPFISILKQFNLRETGFSKYCIGHAILADKQNTNILKSKFLKLDKLKNDYEFFTVA